MKLTVKEWEKTSKHLGKLLFLFIRKHQPYWPSSPLRRAKTPDEVKEAFGENSMYYRDIIGGNDGRNDSDGKAQT